MVRRFDSGRGFSGPVVGSAVLCFVKGFIVEFDALKSVMLEEAQCNSGLLQAIRNSVDMNDLRACVRQAHGVGSDRFRRRFCNVLNACEDCVYYKARRCTLWEVSVPNPDDSHCESLTLPSSRRGLPSGGVLVHLLAFLALCAGAVVFGVVFSRWVYGLGGVL